MFRQEQEMTQAQLGYESGLSRQGVSELERGEVNVTYDTLYSIASVLGVSIKDFLDFEH